MKTYNKFLIISTIFLSVGLVYSYFSKDLEFSNITPIAFGSSLESSNDKQNLDSTSKEDQISSDISFLSTLVSLKKIKINTSLFTDRSFIYLKNNSVNIGKISPGRINPFSPTGSIIASSDSFSSSAKVVTNEATQITDQSVVLNGTINTTNGVTDSYFEYGPTMDLGNSTGKIKQSLVGTFIKNVLGLTPKTNYFFKACAKINNVATCGEIVSFTTN